jgi:hypothetical protein
MAGRRAIDRRFFVRPTVPDFPHVRCCVLPSSWMRCGVSWAVGLGLILASWSSTLRAEPAPPDEQPLRIQYDAHQGCPDAVGFFLHVRARTRRVRLAEEGELATLVTVRIERELTESVGVLEMPGAESRPFERHVRASSCEEVVLALSLVLALAYDPDAVQIFPSAAPEAARPAAPPGMIAQTDKPCPPPPAQIPPSRAAFGVHGLLVSGVSPSVRPGVSGFFEFGRTGRGFAPTLGAAFVWVPSSDTSIEGTNNVARLGYFGGRVTLCPVSWSPAERLELAPCLGADFGRLSGSTDYPDPLGERAIFWGKGFLQARIRWNFLDRFFGETFAAGGVPFYDDRFAVTRSGNPESEVFVVPPVAADLGIGVGAYFP